MGYYDPPDYYETSVEFTCSKCGHEQEGEASHSSKYADEGFIDCEKCGHQDEVSLGGTMCNCGTRCRC